MKQVSWTLEDGAAWVQIQRPEALNALSRKIIDEIDALIEQFREDEEVKAVVFYNRKNFAAGADIGDMVQCTEEEAKQFVFSPTFNKIENLQVPTLAVIEGYALGGGLELALACDFRLGSEEARLGFPEINLGIMPGAGGTVRAAKLIGIAKAKELILLGKNLKGKEAERIGLLNRAVPSAELLDYARKWVSTLIEKAPLAMRTAKETINAAYNESQIAKGVAIEEKNWAALFNTVDQKEGMIAFLEKRKPRYTGK